MSDAELALRLTWVVWNALTEAQRIAQWDRRPWRRHTPKGAN